ncbi:MAG: MCE family protein [Candidatus Obscuribacter sp.]|nr:MCE family protein [Candidatus Obscuribacter sp.]
MNSKPNLEIRVGLFFIIAMFMLTIGWSWLKGISLTHPPQRFIVTFGDVAGLNNNAPVNINGVRVGTVEQIELTQITSTQVTENENITRAETATETGVVQTETKTDTTKVTTDISADTAGVNTEPTNVPTPDAAKFASNQKSVDAAAKKLRERVVNVKVHLKINTEAITIPEGSSITIQTQGLVGAKYIEITLPDSTPTGGFKYISEGETVVGQDPVRIELVMNKIATKMNDIVTSVGSEEVGVSLADALKHSGEAVNSFNQAAKKLDKNMERFQKAADSFTDTSKKVGEAAVEAKSAVKGAGTFFRQGDQTLVTVNGLAKDMKQASGKVNKILDNPALTSDIKETVNLAKQTADSIGVTIKQLNSTLGDQPMRQDLISMLTKINDSVNSIERSVKTVDKISGDQELRSDLKQILSQARTTMDKVETLVNEPDFKTDLRSTMVKVRSAATNVDTAALQLQQVLGQPRPLLKMLFGRPGKLKTTTTTTKKDGKTEVKSETTAK